MRPLVLFILLMATPACGDRQESTRFSADQIVGYKFTVISSTAIEDYSFLEGGSVGTHLGAVNGSITDPILEWKIDQEGRIVIDYGNSTATMTKISERDGTVDLEIAVSPTSYEAKYTMLHRSGNVRPDRSIQGGPFTTGELAGSTFEQIIPYDPIQMKIQPSTYTFDGAGTGTYAGDPRIAWPSEEAKWTFRWSVLGDGQLKVTRDATRTQFWRKISRTGDVIAVEVSLPAPPPFREAFRKTRLTRPNGTRQ